MRFTQLLRKYFCQVQGDHSGCAKPPVGIDVKVAFQYKDITINHNL